MIVFWVIAAAMLLVALSLLLFPLLRRRSGSAVNSEDPNAAVYRERLQELEAERDEGTLDADQFEQARLELERTLLSDLEERQQPSSEPAARKRSVIASVAALVVLPLVAVGLYQYTGRTDLVSPTSPDQLMRGASDGALPVMVNRLVSYARSNPDDLRAWTILGRSYMALDRFSDAERAYREAVDLDRSNPQLLVDYAEARAMARKDDFSGTPKRLLETALRLDPENRKALWLAGIAEFREQNFQRAVDYWQRLKDQFPPDSEPASVVQQNLDKAQSRMSQAGQGAGDAASPAKVEVSVTLAPGLSEGFDPDATVFIFAKAAQGPPMPLAIVRKQLKDLPLTVTLDDTMAMAPQMRLSRFSEVQLVARVSRSGTAAAQSGDLQGKVGPVSVKSKETQEVVIDSRVP